MLSYKVIWGTVVIFNLGFKISSVEKWQETLGRWNIQWILFELFLVESRVELTSILVRITNTLLYLWVCRILTKSIEVSIYSREISCEWIHYDRARGRIGNQVNYHINKFRDDKLNNNRFRICCDSTFSMVATVER